jgi:uncharacterized membrane protein YdbT with pleckstrin-like domain
MKYENVWKKVLSPGENVVEEFTLGRKYILFVQILIGFFGLIFLPILWIFSIILFLLMLFIGWYLKKANAFAFTNKRVLIHKGWLSTHLISIDYDKITDIYVGEPFFEKSICKTGYMNINTAGTGSHEVISRYQPGQPSPIVVLKHIENPYELKKKLDSIRETK